jgi:hypothetical protein
MFRGWWIILRVILHRPCEDQTAQAIGHLCSRKQ